MEPIKKESDAVNTDEFVEFLSLNDKNTREILEAHTKSYYLNKKNYSKNPKVLTPAQVEVLIKLRNNGISSRVVANSLKVQISALTQMVKIFGYRWSVSSKKYLLKDQVPKAIKKQLKEKTNISSLRVDASIYRIIALRAYIEDRTYSQIVSEAILASTNKELRDLANRPNQALKFDRLGVYKKNK